MREHPMHVYSLFDLLFDHFMFMMQISDAKFNCNVKGQGSRTQKCHIWEKLKRNFRLNKNNEP